MDNKQKIIDFSKTIGIEAIGFCRVKRDRQRVDTFLTRQSQGISCDLEEIKDLEASIDPCIHLPGAKSFVVILQSYTLKKNIGSNNALSGMISSGSVFEDYHVLVKRKLELLQTYLKTQFDAESRIYCDQSPFSDRGIAVNAGLGIIGKNGFLLTKKWGTATYIGYLLTDLDLDHYDMPLQEDLCGDCMLCTKTCPNSSILSNRQINATTCISYLTQSKVLTEPQRVSMNRAIYGCDLCQLACPYNRDNLNEMHVPLVSTSINLEDLLGMDNKTFKNTLARTSAGWRGKKMLQRNGVIALGEIGTVECVDILKQHILDQREDIRLEIVGALIRIGTLQATHVLEEMLAMEKSETIILRINHYLR